MINNYYIEKKQQHQMEASDWRCACTLLCSESAGLLQLQDMDPVMYAKFPIYGVRKCLWL